MPYEAGQEPATASLASDLGRRRSCTILEAVKPGKPPEVRKGQDSITIVMDVAPATSRSPIRLVVRCERDGEIYASIERGPDPNAE